MTDTWDPKQYDKFQREREQPFFDLLALVHPGPDMRVMPAQHDALTHRVAEELAGEEPFRSKFGGWRRSQPVLTPEAYARLLYRYGLRETRTQLIVYPHVLGSRDDVVEWVKGTMLTEYKRHLPAAVYDRFVNAYRARLLDRLEDARPFFYPFKRILCWGQRA
jgi:trans-aconitate 2-methyltransferase